MKKIYFAIVLSVFFSISDIHAQSDYKTAIGVKFYPGAFTLKHFIKADQHALEGLLYLWDRGTRITGLYEFHNEINPVNGLKWYVGPGAHVGFYNNKYGGGSSFGVDGVLGLDYKFAKAPINLSLDWQPSVEFNSNYDNGNRFQGDWGGLAIRYTL
jgi:hypothetical protein